MPESLGEEKERLGLEVKDAILGLDRGSRGRILFGILGVHGLESLAVSAKLRLKLK